MSPRIWLAVACFFIAGMGAGSYLFPTTRTHTITVTKTVESCVVPTPT
jgi:hypothetical protein